jgi:ribosome-binding protein aMBF1 (putative translation factor)
MAEATYYCDWCGKHCEGAPWLVAELSNVKLCSSCHTRHYNPPPVLKTGRYRNWDQGVSKQFYKPTSRDPEERYE